jgi:hypothetical protein
MPRNNGTTADEQIEATVSVDDVVFALKMNATHGADDRVIAVPQRDGATASIRRAFRGSERYSNPESAPIHIRPEDLVEDGFTAPPTRHQVDTTHIDVPEYEHERTDEDEQRIDEAHEVLLDTWETDVRGMISTEHEFTAKGVEVCLTGEKGDE